MKEVGGGRWEVGGGRWEVAPKKWWEADKSKLGWRCEGNSYKWWEVGDWSHIQVGDGRLAARNM